MPPQALTDLAGLRVSAEDFCAAMSDTAAQPNRVVDLDDVIRFAIAAAITALGDHGALELPGRRSHETIHQHPDGTPCPAAKCSMHRDAGGPRRGRGLRRRGGPLAGRAGAR